MCVCFPMRIPLGCFCLFTASALNDGRWRLQLDRNYHSIATSKTPPSSTPLGWSHGDFSHSGGGGSDGGDGTRNSHLARLLVGPVGGDFSLSEDWVTTGNASP